MRVIDVTQKGKSPDGKITSGIAVSDRAPFPRTAAEEPEQQQNPYKHAVRKGKIRD